MFQGLADYRGGLGVYFRGAGAPNIIFFAALSSILYYLGVLQKIV